MTVPIPATRSLDAGVSLMRSIYGAFGMARGDTATVRGAFDAATRHVLLTDQADQLLVATQRLDTGAAGSLSGTNNALRAVREDLLTHVKAGQRLPGDIDLRIDGYREVMRSAIADGLAALRRNNS